MKLSFSTLGCPDWDLDQIISDARQNGYEGIDFRGYRRRMDIFNLPEFTSGLADTMQKISSAGLTVCGMSSGARLIDSPEKIRSHIDEVAKYTSLCKAMNTNIIRVFGGDFGGRSEEQALELGVQTLDEMAAIAAPILIGVETHDDFTSSARLAKLLSKSKAKNVCAVWDILHPYRVHRETPQQTWQNIGPKVAYVHWKDGRHQSEKVGDYALTLTGQGDVPLADIYQTLQVNGYNGWLMLEWEKVWHPEIPEPEVAFPVNADFMRRLMNK